MTFVKDFWGPFFVLKSEFFVLTPLGVSVTNITIIFAFEVKFKVKTLCHITLILPPRRVAV